jgi:hypothetical protein
MRYDLDIDSHSHHSGARRLRSNLSNEFETVCRLRSFLDRPLQTSPLNSFSSTIMSGFDALIKFIAKEDQEAYFAPATYREDAKSGAQLVGTTVTGYASIDDLRSESGGKDRTVDKVRVTRSLYSPRMVPADISVAAPCAATFHNNTHLLRRSQLQVSCRGS